ncbi:MAG: hypothetical protein VYB54_05010 [Pseudomonadota bacterium]|nr:hypothetical protein [Pseudomonadota bacterium]
MADPDIRLLQQHLNRTGALLAVDGLCGPRTRAALSEARHLSGGLENSALRDWLAMQPEPVPDLSTDSVNFIVAEEVGSRARYDREATRPHWPGGASGLTIGIGCDLRFRAGSFDDDWGPLLDPGVMAALRPHLGRPGSADAVRDTRHVRIHWRHAWTEFTCHSLPATISATRKAFPAFDRLPDACRAALVSLVHNRGAGLGPGDRRREMRAIRAALDRDDLHAVPGLLLSMQRLWPDVPGLRTRRAREAALWRRGSAGRPDSSGDRGR